MEERTDTRSAETYCELRFRVACNGVRRNTVSHGVCERAGGDDTRQLPRKGQLPDFFVLRNSGTQDLLVYHARDYTEIEGDPLYDPNRHTRVQAIRWKADGMPDFGVPVPETRRLEDWKGAH